MSNHIFSKQAPTSDGLLQSPVPNHCREVTYTEHIHQRWFIELLLDNWFIQKYLLSNVPCLSSFCNLYVIIGLYLVVEPTHLKKNMPVKIGIIFPGIGRDEVPPPNLQESKWAWCFLKRWYPQSPPQNDHFFVGFSHGCWGNPPL